MTQHLKPALLLLALMAVLTGGAYPLAVTVIAQVLFPHQANGSLVVVDGRVVGSELIGQPFDEPGYFWSRPSATPGRPYNGESSRGSNLGPMSAELEARVRERAGALRAGGEEGPIPVDLLTASGSGLDPHISPAAALFQVRRVARARGMDEGAVESLVAEHTDPPFLGLWGERRVNVLLLNLALDGRAPRP